jgi:hypothetical protein
MDLESTYDVLVRNEGSGRSALSVRMLEVIECTGLVRVV